MVGAPGQKFARTESNWAEANVAGILVQLVVSVFFFHVLLEDLARWKQLLLLVPLAMLVWLFWLVLFYINSLAIRLLRTLGFVQSLPDRYAQSFLVELTTTAFAAELLRSTSWARVVGAIWMTAVVLNLSAAALLTLKERRIANRLQP